MPETSSKKILIDIHMHLAATGCQCHECWMSKRLRNRYTVKLLQLWYGISNKELDSTFDETWPRKISELIDESIVDYGVVLGFDGAYNHQTGEINESQSQMIIPPSWVFRTCQQYDNLLPGPSINPHSKDAMEQLDYCIDEGAVLIKWLPPSQGINASSQALLPFYEKLRDSSIPLLVHAGGEKTFETLDEDYIHVNKLTLALDTGVKVICAHTATKPLGSKEEDQVPELIKLLEKYPNLWVDNSGICNPSRFHTLGQISESQIIKDRTLYGSDFPVPSNAFYYLPKLGARKVYQLEREKNMLTRDINIKKEFGYPENSFYRAHEVLANLERWVR